MRAFEREWERSYCFETKTSKRKKMLEEAIETWGMSPENELRKKLFDARYGKTGDQNVDYFIRGWMALKFAGANNKGFFGRKRFQKELTGVLSDWKFSFPEKYGALGEKLLYQELSNMTCVYLKLCREDSHYNSILLGIGRMKEADLAGKIARDIYNIAYEIPKECNMEKEFSLFREAAVDVFLEEFPEQSEAFRERAAQS